MDVPTQGFQSEIQDVQIQCTTTKQRWVDCTFQLNTRMAIAENGTGKTFLVGLSIVAIKILWANDEYESNMILAWSLRTISYRMTQLLVIREALLSQNLLLEKVQRLRMF